MTFPNPLAVLAIVLRKVSSFKQKKQFDNFDSMANDALKQSTSDQSVGCEIYNVLS